MQLRWLHFWQFCLANLVLQPANLFCVLLFVAMGPAGPMKIIKPALRTAVTTIALPKAIQSAMLSAAVMLEARAVLQVAAMASLSANQLVPIQAIMLHAAAERQLLAPQLTLALAGSVAPVLLPAPMMQIAMTTML